MLFIVRYTNPGSSRILSVQMEARNEHDALTSFHKKYGNEPRVVDIKEDV